MCWEICHSNDYFYIWSDGNCQRQKLHNLKISFKNKTAVRFVFESTIPGNKSSLVFQNLKSTRPMSVSQTSWIQLLTLKDLAWLDFERDSTIYLTDISESADSIDRQAVSENDVSIIKTEILIKGHLTPREGFLPSRWGEPLRTDSELSQEDSGPFQTSRGFCQISLK